jgi:hypothetical protein
MELFQLTFYEYSSYIWGRALNYRKEQRPAGGGIANEMGNLNIQKVKSIFNLIGDIC